MEMHYWNKDNFESLIQIAAHLRQTKELVLLADYCEWREKGLRKQALAAVRRFLDESAVLSEERKLELAIFVLELHWAIPQAHQFLTHPLQHEFILPTLRKAAHPGNSAFRNLALLQAWSGGGEEDRNALSLVLQHDPFDIMVRKKLVSMLLNEADFAMHHLHESRFIGSQDYCRTALSKAAALLEPSVADPNVFTFLAEEHSTLSAKLEDWLEYKKTAQTTSFPDWCASMGHEYGWSLTIYYNA